MSVLKLLRNGADIILLRNIDCMWAFHKAERFFCVCVARGFIRAFFCGIFWAVSHGFAIRPGLFSVS